MPRNSMVICRDILFPVPSGISSSLVEAMVFVAVLAPQYFQDLLLKYSLGFIQNFHGSDGNCNDKLEHVSFLSAQL